MIELKHDNLLFSFPHIHEDARLSIDFQRTLRIPDDEGTYALPPGLGNFPLRHVDDFAAAVPATWLEHGGVMLPMFQSEALWLNFDASWIDDRQTAYPFAVKVATGKLDAVTGKDWSNALHRGPQDYMVVPGQPWLDGYCVERGLIRQFVAMPLGAGYSAEEQVSGKAEHGGLQIIVYPMKRDVFEKRFPVRRREAMDYVECKRMSDAVCMPAPAPAGMDMGLAPGGKMRQEIYTDAFDLADWDLTSPSRCFVHIANSLVWSGVTGERPPNPPPTAAEYTRAGLPWFEYYGGDAQALEGSPTLGGLKSVVQIGQEKGDVPLPENESVTPEQVIQLRKALAQDQVREGAF